MKRMETEQHGELGSMQRRRILRTVGAGAATAVSLSVFAADVTKTTGETFAVATVNHLSYASRDYKVTRDFYVDFFGMRDVWDDGTKCQLDCGPEDAPNTFYLTGMRPGMQATVAHFSFGLPDYWRRADQLRDELYRRKLPGVHPDGEAGWFVNGPSGYVQHIVTVKDPAMFPGAAAPCKVARSEQCKAAYALGVTNLDAAPKPSGKGFKAMYFKTIVAISSSTPRAGCCGKPVIRNPSWALRTVTRRPCCIGTGVRRNRSHNKSPSWD